MKQNGKCDQFAKVFSQKLREIGIAFEIIRIDTVARYIYSDKFGNQIGNNSFHYGIRIGNLVYDNLTTKGLEFGKWLSDLGADGSFADTTWRIVNQILSH